MLLPNLQAHVSIFAPSSMYTMKKEKDSPLHSIVDSPPLTMRLSRPIAPQTEQIQVFERKVDRQTGQLLDSDIAASLVRDIHTPHDGIKLRENTVGQIRRDCAVVVIQMHYQRRDIPRLAKRRRQPRQARFPVQHLVALIPQVAHSVAGSLTNAHGRDAEIAAALVWELATDATNRAHPATDAGLSGRAGRRSRWLHNGR